MIELLRVIKIVGLRNLLRLLKAARIGYMGNINGHYTTRIMCTLFNVGFFDEMGTKGSINVDSFASTNGLNNRILTTLCDSLYSLRILKKNGANYSLDSKGKVLVDVARGWFEIVNGYEDVLYNLEPLLKNEKAYGKEIKRNTELVAKGSGNIEKWIYFPLAADIVRKNGYKRVLDLGCGDGTFLRHLCANVTQVEGFGLDIAKDAIEDGRIKLQRSGLQSRIHLITEDVCKIQALPKEFQNIDAAFTFFVPHEILAISTDTLLEFLRSFRSLFPGVPLIVFEVMKPTPEQMRARPGPAVYYFLYHELSNQKPVDRDEWIDVFKRAGFNSIDERYLGFARTAIYTLS